jgi:hypothetical protein
MPNDFASSSGIFANPSYSFGVTKGSEEQITTPAGFVGDTTDRNNTEVSLAGEFSGDLWYWRLAHTVSKEMDDTDLYSDLENSLTSLDASISVTPLITLGPVIQVTRSRDIDLDTTIDGWNAGMTINYDNNKDWRGGLSYTVFREDGHDDFTNTRTSVIEFMSTWAYQIAKGTKPGIHFFTKANYQKSSSLDINSDQYQVFVGLNINYSVVF